MNEEIITTTYTNCIIPIMITLNSYHIKDTTKYLISGVFKPGILGRGFQARDFGAGILNWRFVKRNPRQIQGISLHKSQHRGFLFTKPLEIAILSLEKIS